MGFQDMHPILREAAGRKGGKVRKPKGLSALSPERRKQIASMGGRQRADNRRKGAEQTQDDSRNGGANLADILGTLDE